MGSASGRVADSGQGRDRDRVLSGGLAKEFRKASEVKADGEIGEARAAVEESDLLSASGFGIADEELTGNHDRESEEEDMHIRRRKICQIYLYRRNFRWILRGLRNISDAP